MYPVLSLGPCQIPPANNLLTGFGPAIHHWPAPQSFLTTSSFFSLLGFSILHSDMQEGSGKLPMLPPVTTQASMIRVLARSDKTLVGDATSGDHVPLGFGTLGAVPFSLLSRHNCNV